MQIVWTRTDREVLANGVVVPRWNWALPMAIGCPREWLDIEAAPNEPLPDALQWEGSVVWEYHPGNGSGGPPPALTVNGVVWAVGQFESRADAATAAKALGCPQNIISDWVEGLVSAGEDLKQVNRAVSAYWSEILR